MSEEKTEEPTEKRLRDARERGEVTKSTDLTGSVVLISTVCILIIMQGFLENGFRTIMKSLFLFIPTAHSFTDLATALQSILVTTLHIIFLFAASSCAAGILALLPQVGFGFTLTPVTPKPDAINPANGIKNIFSIRALTDFLRTIIKAIIISVVMWKTIEYLLPLIGSAMQHPLEAIIQVSWAALIRLFLIACAVFFLIGAVDFKFQVWMFMRQHRMSHTEIKQEYKESEGDPHVKGARKELAREIAFSPSLKQAIKKSNVLVANPTHYAIVLRYRRNERRPPHIVAKGRDQNAIELRTIAASMGIPIVTNPKVARALFTVPVNKNIPEEYFSTVAAILLWVENIGGSKEDNAGELNV